MTAETVIDNPGSTIAELRKLGKDKEADAIVHNVLETLIRRSTMQADAERLAVQGDV